MTSRSIAARRRLYALTVAILGPATARAGITSSGDITPANPSTWTIGTTAYVGNTSTGTVSVSAGGGLASGTTYLGYGPSASGTVNVDGTASSWATTSPTFFGYAGSGAMAITGGGRAFSGTAYLGYGPSANGTVTVDGTASFWSASTFYVGYAGTGALTITGGAQVTLNTTYQGGPDAGEQPGSSGVVTVSGSGSALLRAIFFTIGKSGNGTLNISSGGIVSDSYAYLGSNAGSTGQATVDGTGSTWTSIVLTVGGVGSGTLTISNGGLVRGTAGIYVLPGTGWVDFASGGTLAPQTLYAAPTQFSGTGTINARGLVTDADLIFDASHGPKQTLTWLGNQQNIAVNLDLTGASGAVGDLGAGYQGTGSLMIRDGRVVNSVNGYLGYGAGSTGTATVDGTASAWNALSIYVGNSGNGVLNITHGAIVTAATSVQIAANPSATGTINFGASGGTLATASLYAVPSQFTGTGTVLCRGLVTDGNLVFDASHGLTRTLNWTGAGQNVTVNLDMSGASGTGGALGVGYQIAGTLSISGISVTSSAGVLGYQSGASGVAKIDGANSVWNSNTLNCGYSGTGLLTITNGGVVNSTYNGIGSSAGASGVVIVDGAGSTWNIAWSADIGSSGMGTLHITNGGKVTSGGTNGGINIGAQNGAIGAVTVDGNNSSFILTGNLTVGEFGTGSLAITRGGNVTGPAVGIGYGKVTVDGAGSVLNAGSLTISVWLAGSSVMAITNGGQVSANGFAIEGQGFLAINVGDGSGLADATPLTNFGIVRLEAVPGATAGTYTPIVASTWSGSGTVQALGGSWNTASHQFTVSPAASATTGQAVTFDTIATQRVVITDPSGDSVQAGFQATAASSSPTFTAWELTQDQTLLLENTVPVGTQVLDGWTFLASGYTAGSPVFLSLKVGPGYSAGNLEVWHFDGTSWTLYPTSDLSYDGTYANFTVTGFSGYAVTTVAPEPASLGMLAVSGSLLLRRRKAGTAGVRRRGCGQRE